MIGLVVVAGVMLWRSYVDRPPRSTPKWLAIAIIAAAVIGSTGTVVQAILIGHSGATAVWQEDMSNTPAPSGDSD